MSDRTPCQACRDGRHLGCEYRACPCAADHRWRALTNGGTTQHAHAGVSRLARTA